MLKKCFLYFLTFILIASSCAVAFSSFALEAVSLPFPSPDKFGANCPIITYERSDGQYYMIVLYRPADVFMDIYSDASYESLPVEYSWRYYNNKIQIFVDTRTLSEASSSYALNLTPIIYYYNPSNGYYNIQIGSNVIGSNHFVDILNVGSSRSISDVVSYHSNIFYDNDSGLRQHNKYYVFSGELNQPDLNSYLLMIDNSLKVAIQSMQTWQNEQTSFLTSFMVEYLAMNDKLSSIDSNLQILVDSMTESHSSPQTTVNSAVSDYNSAESQVGSQHFNALDNFNVPDFSSSLGEGVLSALSFLSVQLEDFTGNGTGMTGGSIKKIASVIFIVLMLGLVTLILAMNRRTD